MYTLSDLYKLKGYKVHIVTAEGEYEGVIKNFHVSMDQVTLEKVFIMPKRLPVGTLHFFVFEIKSCKIIEEPKDISKNKPQNKPGSIVSNIIDYNTLTVDGHALRHNDKSVNFVPSCPPDDFQDVSDYFADSDDTSTEVPPWEKEEEEEEFILSLPKYLGDNLPPDWLVVREINDEFFKVIKHINQESVIAVSFEGESIGRSGKLSLIGISTRCCTFLFDILVLQKEVFQKGLKEVFENPGVQKVIHDCRQASDALFHLYDTSLVNVFDTQVADVFVRLHSSKNGKVQRNVSSMSGCIKKYLQFTDEDMYPDEADCHALKEAVKWMHRPINNVMKEVAIKNVILLRPLRTVLMEQMLSSYTHAVNVYLGVLRNATHQELELNPSFPELLPEALLLNGLHTVQCSAFSETGVFPSNTSALYKNKESAIFNLVLNNYAKKAHSDKKNPSRFQKKKRSTTRPVCQDNASLSSDEEIESNEKKPRRLHRTHHSSVSAFSSKKANTTDKKTLHVNKPKSVCDNTVLEKISRISLKDFHSNPQIALADHNQQCVHSAERYHQGNHQESPSSEKHSPLTALNLNSVEIPKTEENTVCKSLESLVDDSIPRKPLVSEDHVKRSHPEPQQSTSNNITCAELVNRQSTAKPKDQSMRSNLVSNCSKKQVELRYMPAGMLS